MSANKNKARNNMMGAQLIDHAATLIAKKFVLVSVQYPATLLCHPFTVLWAHPHLL